LPNEPKIDQLVNRVREIRSKCTYDGMSLINAYPWDQGTDLRITSIRRLTRIIIALNLSLLYLAKIDVDEFADDIRLDFEHGIDIKQYLLVNELFVKIGYVSSLFFVIESVFRDYLRFMNIQAYEKVRHSVNQIFKLLIEDTLTWDLYRFDRSVFDLLRLIRNTLHNNGAHLPLRKNEKHVQIKYRGHTYEFIDGEILDFISWDLLLDLSDDIRSLFFHIANNEMIRSIEGRILDDHAIY